MSIKTKLILIGVLSLSAVLIFGSAFFLINQKSVILQQKKNHVDELIFTVFERNLFFNDYLRAPTSRAKQQLMSRNDDIGTHITRLISLLANKDDQDDAEEILRIRDVNHIVVTSDIERVLAQEAEVLPAFYNQIILNIYSKSQSSAQIAKKLGQKYQGELDRLRATTNTLLAVLSFVGLLFALGAIKVVFSIGRSIAELQNGVREITAGNLKHRVSVKSRDEIGVLGQSFNDMADELVSSYGKIEKSKKILEDRVREQTKELSGKVALLEQFKVIAEEREHKMIELKSKTKAKSSKNINAEKSDYAQ
jgi:methyl-accepting chemotaxis protein